MWWPRSVKRPSWWRKIPVTDGIELSALRFAGLTFLTQKQPQQLALQGRVWGIPDGQVHPDRLLDDALCVGEGGNSKDIWKRYN